MKQDSRLTLSGIAQNGSIALQKVSIERPDCVVVDSDVEGEDVVLLVRKLVELMPRGKVVVFGRNVKRGSALVLDFISAGATDCIAKPAEANVTSPEWKVVEETLLPKLVVQNQVSASRKETADTLEKGVKAVGDMIRKTARARTSEKAAKFRGNFELLCIGSSTGGPNALATLFETFSSQFPVPVLITQHMPPMFTDLLAKRLNGLDTLKFFEATDGMQAKAGCAYIAPGGKHMVVTRANGSLTIRLNEDPPEHSCRPAVDVMLRSVVDCVGGAVLVTILTGMGKDGCRGCEQLSELGATVFAQDEESSVVWGMPGFVTAEGIADEVIPLNEISERIHAAFRCRFSRTSVVK